MAVQKLTLRAPQQEAWDQFLVGKLRSCTLHGVPKENNKQTNNLLDLPYPSILIHIKSTLTIFFQQMKISNKISFWWKIRKKGVECLKSEEGGICEDIKWKVEKGRRLKCFILLLTSGPVCLRWEPFCWGMFLSCQMPRGSSAWLDLWRWDWNIFFFHTASFPEDLLIEVSPLKNHWVKLIYYFACFWFPPGQLLHNVN